MGLRTAGRVRSVSQAPAAPRPRLRRRADTSAELCTDLGSPTMGHLRDALTEGLKNTSLTQPWGAYVSLSPSCCYRKPTEEVQEVNQGTRAGARVIPRLPPAPSSLREGSTQQSCSKADPPELHSERQSQNLLQNQSDSKIFHNNILFPPILFSLQCPYMIFSSIKQIKRLIF